MVDLEEDWHEDPQRCEEICRLFDLDETTDVQHLSPAEQKAWIKFSRRGFARWEGSIASDSPFHRTALVRIVNFNIPWE